MKTLLILLASVISLTTVLQAQQTFPLKDLTVGNRFVYNTLYRELYPGAMTIPAERDSNYRYYDHVLRDTLIGTKRYGVVFHSFDRSITLERSDDTTVYVWNNGVEKPLYRWNMKNGDSIDVNILGFRYQGTIIDQPRKYPTGINFGDSLMVFSLGDYYYTGPIFDPQYSNRLAPTSMVFFRPLGVSQINMVVAGLPRGFLFGLDRMLQGAVIRGQVYRDTNTRNTKVDVKQPTVIAASLKNIPNPFGESLQLEYSLAGAAQDVELHITSLRGETLAVLPQGARATGSHSIEWNGRTADGRDVPQGAYIVSLVVNGRKQNDVKVMKAR